MYKTIEDYPLTLEPKDIQEILKMGRVQSYNLLKDPPFPVKRVGKDIKVFRDTFFEWYGSK